MRSPEFTLRRLFQSVFDGMPLMPFLGTLTTGHCPHFGQAYPERSKGSLPHIASSNLKDRRFAVWGRVPVASSAGQGILLEGRIFNAAELADELGVPSLDVPMLLLHAYRRWGSEFSNHLQGEFAFVLWDEATRRLLFGRDPSGYRPLFYAQHGEDIRFASDANTLLHWPNTKISPNETHIAHWLALVSTGTGSTFFESILRLPPGASLLFENGRIVSINLWEPENLPMLELRDPREYAAGLREVLEKAITDRLQAGAIAGSQLSGGLDSSSVTALAARHLESESRRLFAFTAIPQYAATVPGRFCDEGPHAASVSAMYPNVDHILVRHGSHSAFSMIDRFSSAEQQPIFSPANYDWVYEICLQARQRGVDTLQTGSAGDYTVSYHGAPALSTVASQGRYIKAARLAWDLHREGTASWPSIAHSLIDPWVPRWVRSSIQRIRARPADSRPSSMIRWDFARPYGLHATTMDDRLRHMDSRLQRLFILRRADPGPIVEAFRQLSGVSLTDATMDKRVVEYCLSVPVEHFCERGIPRSLMRNAMSDVIPKKIYTERRRGLQAADFGAHFGAERQEALAELSRMRKVGLAVRSMDLPAIEGMMHWSESRIVAHGWDNYWPVLMRALSLGRFLRRLDDGTLFA